MPAYSMPGTTMTQGRSLIAGVLVLAVLIAAITGWRALAPDRDAGMLRIRLHTSRIGEGIGSGAGVRLNGVQIGDVTGITALPDGDQLISLALRRDQLGHLRDSVRVEYAPSNLFGISEVVLHREPGGSPLHDGSVVDLTGRRVADDTMGNLLRSMAQVISAVLTPQLTTLLNQAGSDIAAFAPLLRAVAGVSRAVADTQRFGSAFLIRQYASFLDGVGNFASGFIQLIDQVYHIQVLRTDRAHFDVGVALVADQLFPLISTLGWTAQGYLGGYADRAAGLLGTLAHTVPDPDRAHADLTELLARLDRAFRGTPDGPQLGVEVLVRGMPGLAVPLLGGPARTPGGVR